MEESSWIKIWNKKTFICTTKDFIKTNSMEIKEYKWSITDGRDSQPRAQEATRTGLNILLKTFNISKIFPLQITGTCCALSQRFVLFCTLCWDSIFGNGLLSSSIVGRWWNKTMYNVHRRNFSIRNQLW